MPTKTKPQTTTPPLKASNPVNTLTIDLETHIPANIRTLTDKALGRTLRDTYELAKMDASPHIQVVVIIPHTIWSLTNTFFTAMFGESVALLKAENFRQKYSFECEPLVAKQIEADITFIASSIAERAKEKAMGESKFDFDDF